VPSTATSTSLLIELLPPAILLGQQGKKFDDFLNIVPTASWQGQIDAVIAKQVRATMVPEDTWRTNPANNADDQNHRPL